MLKKIVKKLNDSIKFDFPLNIGTKIAALLKRVIFSYLNKLVSESSLFLNTTIERIISFLKDLESFDLIFNYHKFHLLLIE